MKPNTSVLQLRTHLDMPTHTRALTNASRSRHCARPSRSVLHAYEAGVFHTKECRVAVFHGHALKFFCNALGAFAHQFGMQASDEAKREKYALAEIKHSRLAMLAFSGMVHQYFITQQVDYDVALYGCYLSVKFTVSSIRYSLRTKRAPFFLTE